MKDQICLFKINDWLIDTAEMDAECRSWYLTLIIHQYKDGYLPNNIDMLANLCGVENIDIQRFSNIFKNELIKKFKVIDNLSITSISSHFSKYSLNEKEQHWNWKGGITPELKKIRSSSRMINWRKKIYSRDNYTCRICSKKGGKLNAHHIKYFSTNPDLRFDLDNGITLCKECHIELHKKN